MFRGSGRRGTGESGFTLLELVIVIGAIAIVMAMLIVGIRQSTQSFTLRRATTLVYSELRKAHAAAMAEGVDYIVEFDVVTGSGTSNGIKVFRLPAGSSTPELLRQVKPPDWPSSVQLLDGLTQVPACPSLAGLDTSNDCAIFKPLGYASAAGDVRLKTKADAAARLRIIVASATGRVSMERL